MQENVQLSPIKLVAAPFGHWKFPFVGAGHWADDKEITGLEQVYSEEH